MKTWASSTHSQSWKWVLLSWGLPTCSLVNALFVFSVIHRGEKNITKQLQTITFKNKSSVLSSRYSHSINILFIYITVIPIHLCVFCGLFLTMRSSMCATPTFRGWGHTHFVCVFFWCALVPLVTIEWGDTFYSELTLIYKLKKMH